MTPTRASGHRAALQQLVMKRFGMAAGSYALALLLTWITVLGGFYQAPVSIAWTGVVLIVASQLGFLYVFATGLNQRFEDPSLTEAQVLVGLLWLTFFLSSLGSVRGSFMVLYILVLLFAVFLRPAVFARYATLAFLSFVGLNLWDFQRGHLLKPEIAFLQACILLVTLVWMCLFVGYVYRLRQRMRQRRMALQAHQETLRGMMNQLQNLASTDGLTGLHNRRHFIAQAHAELKRLRRGQQSGLALIDLDNFKRINDLHGHAAGDKVLQAFAGMAGTCLRETDLLARYGGEEFVLLLPDTDPEQLATCCERLREAFATAEPADAGISRGQLSLSIGMTLLLPEDDLDLALQRADQALYRAKRLGRNRCEADWLAPRA
ncbi:GGDEF domain-containing protein [Stutzerimonas azotifigens]|uniref:GGDEF domain-containing protein n=1 Tax=Stutzerimonas azotifigens TaxID=291995 RepID=UPI00047FA9CE|nr:GGDEF domain-containing protein [Stutzerimonas azotifigens]